MQFNNWNQVGGIMQIKSENEILDQAVRKRIIEEINGSENKSRKDEYFKRYQVYKDNTSYYVISKMLQLFEQDTVREMSYAISNISLSRKIIDKLARVYSNGVKRTVLNEEGASNDELTKNVEEITKVLNINTNMKRTNRANKRDKNTLFYVKPYSLLESGIEKFSLDPKPLFPYLYDVVENAEQREKPLCIILSHYSPPSSNVTLPIQNERQAGIHTTGLGPKALGDQKDQSIADSPVDQDEDKKQLIWWSDNYHFTTNQNGEIVSESNENPISKMPFVNFAQDQDGAFWAVGGGDLVDGSILVNCMISHTNHVGIVQGYGQFYMTGKNLPSGVKIGPSRGIKVEYEKDDPVPALGFLSANPPLADLRQLIEMYVALLLTTNNLSVSGVATQLGNTSSPASGVALILDKAESMEDVKDQEQIFHDNEPSIWDLIAKWTNFYRSKGLLSSALDKFAIPENMIVSLKFGDVKLIMTEKEKLDNIQLRKDLGINTMVELLMSDDPSLTESQAEEKLIRIMEEKMERMAQATGAMDENNPSTGNPNPNNLQNQPGTGGNTTGDQKQN